MTILFAYPGHDDDVARLASISGAQIGKLQLHSFPDGETLVRLLDDVSGQDVALYCSLDQPDSKAMGIMFFARTAKELGAKSVTLIAPYLGYMRQDKRFHEGEAITSIHFASFLSDCFHRLITVDPHLHRHKSLAEIYTNDTHCLHAANAIAGWIKQNVSNPVLIGPDEESDQWVSDVAERAGAAYTVLTKIRRGDHDVEVSVPDVEQYQDHTPVLVDDIISTARTMIDTISHLKRAGMAAPICIGVHAVFAGDGFDALTKAGPAQIVTCNTIPHETNQIDLGDLFAPFVA